MSGDIACSFSEKKIKNVSTNQRPGWPPWMDFESLEKLTTLLQNPQGNILWQLWRFQMK
jgi:hypothetical protein